MPLAESGNEIVQLHLVFGGLVELYFLSGKHIGLVNHRGQVDLADWVFAERTVQFARDVDIMVAFEETIIPTAHRSDVARVRCLERW